MRLREGQAGALELKAALRSAVELATLPAPAYAIEIFLRWVAPALQHECGHRHTSQRQRSNREALKFFFVFFFLGERALSDTSPERRRTPGAALALVGWHGRPGRRRATAAAPRSFVRGSAVGLDFSLQCTAARAGFTQEGVRTAFANRLCESLGCLDLRER